MSLIIPILLATLGIGLFAPRMTSRWWILLAGWIVLVLLYNFFKHTPLPLPPDQQLPPPQQQEVGSSRNVHDFSVGKA